MHTVQAVGGPTAVFEWTKGMVETGEHDEATPEIRRDGGPSMFRRHARPYVACRFFLHVLDILFNQDSLFNLIFV